MAIAYVNGTDRSNNGNSDGSDQSTGQWANNLVVGNFGECAVFWKGSENISGIADAVGNSYLDCGAGPVDRLGDGRLQVFGAKNLVAGTTPIVTVQFTGVATNIDIYFRQYSGVHLTAPFDVFASGTNNTGTTIVTGTFTPTISDGAVLAFGVSNDTNGLVGNIGGVAATSRVAPAGWGTMLEDRIFVGAMGTNITAAVNMSTSLTLGAIIATVLVPAAGGGGSAAPAWQAINRRRR